MYRALLRRSLEPFSDGPCASVSFDNSGLYLAVGGPSVKVYGVVSDTGWLAAMQCLRKQQMKCSSHGSTAPEQQGCFGCCVHVRAPQ